MYHILEVESSVVLWRYLLSDRNEEEMSYYQQNSRHYQGSESIIPINEDAAINTSTDRRLYRCYIQILYIIIVVIILSLIHLYKSYVYEPRKLVYLPTENSYVPFAPNIDNIKY